MTQSNQQPHERKFIAVTFRGVQTASRERTALTIVGQGFPEVIAAPAEALPEPEELDPEAQPRPPLGALASVTLTLGGEAARAAFVYAALNGDVTFAGEVPAGADGDLVLRWLETRGADVQRARRGGSGPRVLVAVPGRQNLAIGSVASGAAASPAVSGGDGRGALLLAGYPFAGGLRGQAAADLLKDARGRGRRTVVSLCPVAAGGPGRPLTPEDIEPLLPYVDLLCGGPAELRRATRRPEAQDAARALLVGGARAVLVKRGADGAALFQQGPAALERFDTPTSGAADALAGGADPLRLAIAYGAVFDAAYLLGEALNDAAPVRFATAAAVRVAQSPEGVLGL